ncbi:hypothetical protein PVK06_041855 [Gossypium arboreum]|uniref:Uncharacterized protein n=1 Tax=Gossypium arboreum TaxID=29729 RepID=A0ABR0NAA6_GOSAR|nr:hypothetical protein PVK06_041855 [Gossypium arboreum]
MGGCFGQLNRPLSRNFRGVAANAYSAIKVSYDRLRSEEHKQIFLLRSLMGHNALFEELLMYAMGLGLFHGVNTVEETQNRLLTVVSHLKASCSFLYSYTNQRLDMHDLIFDVAMWIASKGSHLFVLKHNDVLSDWPDDEMMKECYKINLLNTSINKLPDQLKWPKLTFFGMGSKDPLMKIPTNVLKDFPSLPSSISLLANLRTLCLVKCVLGDKALIGELRNLEILSLESSDIEMLPKEIGQPTKLKCEWGADGHSSEQSNSSLAELKALSCLTSLDIHTPNANIIPKDFSFEKLRRYIIFIGEASNWEWGWPWVREYSTTLKLNLQTSISKMESKFY